MKLFFLFLFIPFLSVAQSEIQFQDLTFGEALAQSKISKRPVFFMAYASWCPHCRKMMEDVFVNPAVADFYNTSFICIKQDMEKGDGIALYKKFDIKSYPTLIYLDANGTILYQVAGESDADGFIQHGKNALTPEKQLPYLQRQFEMDSSDPDKCYAYIVALKRGLLDVSEVMHQYLSTKTESQLLNELNWKILTNGITDITSPYFQFIIDHQSQYAAITSPARVQRKIFYTVKQQLEPLVATTDTVTYFKLRATAADIHNTQVDSLLFTLDMNMYVSTKNWAAYQVITLQNTKTYVWNNATLLGEIADIYLRNINDTSALSQAASWAIRALDLNETYRGYLLVAKLFKKATDFPMAIQMATKAKQEGAKNGWDTSEAEALLQELGQ
jgi:thioredoxin-related protein